KLKPKRTYTHQSPVMTASGTAGHGDEQARYVDLASLGAVVVKSLAAEPWPGNAAPRVHETQGGMLNSVGLQGPGVEAWLRDELPPLLATGATVVASIWGRTVDEYAAAAALLADAPPQVVAVEVNLSCPNLHHGRAMFAQLPETAAEAVAATASCGRPRWAKLTPMVADLVPIAAATRDAGARAARDDDRAARGSAAAAGRHVVALGGRVDRASRRARSGRRRRRGSRQRLRLDRAPDR
ncbi:MAG: hypothetical protein ACJ77E_02435, partial [Gaiellaceae bacterium]